MVVSESSQAYPLEKYSITAHEISNPDDYDGDGMVDYTNWYENCEYDNASMMFWCETWEEYPYLESGNYTFTLNVDNYYKYYFKKIFIIGQNDLFKESSTRDTRALAASD